MADIKNGCIDIKLDTENIEINVSVSFKKEEINVEIDEGGAGGKEYLAGDGIELDGSTFKLTRETKNSLLKADSALQEYQRNPIVLGSCSVNGDYNLITMDGKNLAADLDLEIGDVISIGNGSNKIKEGSYSGKWSGTTVYNGTRFYCADGGGVWIDKGECVVKVIDSDKRYTGLACISMSSTGGDSLFACVYGGGIYLIDYDKELETATETKLLGDNDNSLWTGIIGKSGLLTGVVSGVGIYTLSIVGGKALIKVPQAIGGADINHGGLFVGEKTYFVDRVNGSLYFVNNNKFLEDTGYDGYNFRRITQDGNRGFVYTQNGRVFEINDSTGELVEIKGFLQQYSYVDFAGIAFDSTGNGDFVKACWRGIETLDVVATEKRLRTVEFIGDGVTDIGQGESFIVPIGSIIVNYEHCGKRGDGSYKLVSGIGLKNVVIERFKKWHEAPLGLGQAWVSLAYQALDVSRFNSTNRMINIAAGSRVRDAKVTIEVDGVKVAETMDTFNNVTLPRASASALIPIGADYTIIWYGQLNNGTNFNFWSEMR